ncbi:hypothetical protein SAMN05428988_3805 [Chitinophaga sp. YR573]|uniref:DUF6088 family protein n=1 Tax=Chitinophaga sp. YR573 TaxID=1881040 RepID=UPI0008CE5811|nr:DUF6088 family protein [Chitinophaga sp. YR573]SEW26884.1 hypothetical protein SAMN05428988_3805 [Chitinophaga sp. YR573]
MTKLQELKKHLKKGKVYRRTELAQWSKSIDRHLDELVQDETLQKLSQGVYYFPKETAFGKTPPEEEVLIRSFLKDDRFLITSPNAYNSLGVGTTQLYNTRTVYNHKRHGEFKLGNRVFIFKLTHHFPAKATQEFLLVDLANNLEKLAEDHIQISKNILSRAYTMDIKKLKHAVSLYGNAKAKKLLMPVVNKTENL